MPLFGLRKTKKNEQSQIQTAAGDAKNSVAKTKRSKKTDNAPQGHSVAPVKQVVALPKGTFGGGTEAIIRPHVTEKTGIQSQNGVYTFQVSRNANKNTVATAIKALYKVTPVKIGIINVPVKNVFVRGKKGTVAGMRKAIVTVKKGDKIDFV